MGVNISAGNLMTMHKLKNTDATSNFHNDQCNLPSAAQISIRICSDLDVFFWHSKLLIINAVLEINMCGENPLPFYHVLSVLCSASS